ncbi:sigma-54 dependent transcriptional regulator [Bacteriovoracales bacterium]|nr:sigma-54 dependent transcriptional regulator [Bacteriovoracales bacterium]
MKNSIRILIVEDDKYFREELSEGLRSFGPIDEAETFLNAQDLLLNNFYHVVLIDLNLSGQNEGLDLIGMASKKGSVPIVLTGHQQNEIISKAYSLGCRHYFNKLDIKSDIQKKLGPYLKALGEENFKDFFTKDFITQDKKLIKKIELLKYQNLNSDQKVLLLGPTGVGKTRIAKLIHELSQDKGEFVHVNVSEIPETLAEGLLFGHQKGSFTGALNDQEGLLKKADGGTLFLDEIGTIPLHLQKKLLKAIETKEFTPLGSKRSVKSNFRLISATCDCLSTKIEKKEFRLDFYFRIKGIEIDITPLQERVEDIPLLINYFLKNTLRKIVFSPEALECLQNYDWHGNVRELENLIRELSENESGLIHKEQLPFHIQKNKNPFRKKEDTTLYSKTLSKYIKKNGLRDLISQLEEEAFKEAFKEFKGKITKVQKALQISSTACYRIMENINQKEIIKWKSN